MHTLTDTEYQDLLRIKKLYKDLLDTNSTGSQTAGCLPLITTLEFRIADTSMLSAGVPYFKLTQSFNRYGSLNCGC